MMHGLRLKLSLGFSGLLVIILVIGIQAILRVSELGQSIDIILRENYLSVIACQNMKESLERVDSATLFVLLGYEEEGKAQIQEHLARFEKAMRTEGGNITLPGEGLAFESLKTSYSTYQGILKRVIDADLPMEARRSIYFAELLPQFKSIKESAGQILQMNQENMSEANMSARHKAAKASQRMYLLLICGVVIAGTFIIFIRRWILRPITALTASAHEIAQGNLDLFVGTSSRDEIGQLAQAFDIMASSLRKYRRANEANLFNIQKAAEQALESLSVAILVVDLDGVVEMATQAAQDTFSVEPGAALRESAHAWMNTLVARALKSRHREMLDHDNQLIQIFVDGNERFFQPEAIPVLDPLGQPTGVTLMLHDATQLRQSDELKRGLISTVSHQLKTPLTSIRMALYLLLDDKLGPLTPKQEELIIAARDDSNRLHAIVEDLLDIARIQSGRIQMELHSVAAAVPALEAVEAFQSQAQDRGIKLTAVLPAGLPEVQADSARIPHVFANLLANAIKYTSPGGEVTVTAHTQGNTVLYSVTDTGTGIPTEYLPRIFEQFYRVPEQGGGTGAGLGLAIAKEIVTAHGGELWVQSRLGAGSTFSFSLKQSACTDVSERTT